MVRFENVYIAPRVRVALNSVLEAAYAKKFWNLVAKLKSGRFDIKGLRVEKLHTRKGKVYSARLNVEIRVIFSMFGKENNRCLVIWDANHHDDAYDRVKRATIPFLASEPADTDELEPVESWGDDSERSLADLSGEAVDDHDVTDGLLLFQVPHYVLSEPDRYPMFARNIDRYLRLTSEQEELISKSNKAFIVQGSAGTGKTTLALFHALNLYETNPNDDIFFFTYQDELACVCRSYKVNLVGQEGDSPESEESGLRVFSYLQFCKHYLKRHLDSGAADCRWIDRQESINLLDKIISAKSRWSRTIQAEDTYSYIYSILKGRFVPGTSDFPETPEDYQRIFKGYGTSPRNLAEILEIFQQYQDRLSQRNQKDEADLIRYCYESMKGSAVISDDRRATWIVIDEIQDFTELEWKSILLFWRNKVKAGQTHLSFPFLSGDRNQNITRSGFRWQEVDSYVSTSLKELHRPRSLKKVQLHTNFRNTLEIFNLGKFLRDCAPETTGDLGAPPSFSGEKPRLVIGPAEQFRSFLGSLGKDTGGELPQPLVVLCEDPGDQEELLNSTNFGEGLFVLDLHRSKGMEFEDCIVYRLFSGAGEITEDTGEDVIARLYDLWYMAVTRARRSLLIYLTPADWQFLQTYFQNRIEDLLALTEFDDRDPTGNLKQFFAASEKYIPNYNVIFLEREKAQQLWKRADSAAGLNPLKEKALGLWKKCRDWKALGLAYKSLERWQEAVKYLEMSHLPDKAAQCWEKLGDFKKAAGCFEQAGQMLDAARCLVLSGDHAGAAPVYEKNGLWKEAAECYEEADDFGRAARCFEKASSWPEAANMYRLQSKWIKAAELYQKAGDFETAATMYLKVKDKLDAAKCYMAAKQHMKAATLMESLNRWAQAAECYEKEGDLKKATSMYAKAGKIPDTARCAEASGDLNQAAQAYERMKNWGRAADCYRAAGITKKAVNCYEKARDWIKAMPLYSQLEDWQGLARCCEQQGDLARAAEYYLKADSANEAGYCYQKAGLYREASDCFLKADNLGEAASMLCKQDRPAEAARLFLQAGDITRAMDIARQAGRNDGSRMKKDLRIELASWAEEEEKFDLAGAIYEHLGHYMLAGHRYRQAMMPGEAAKCFEKDSKFTLAADLYVQDSQWEKAAHCYKQLKNWARAAELYEKGQNWKQAMEFYEKCGDNDGVRRCQSSAKWL